MSGCVICGTAAGVRLYINGRLCTDHRPGPEPSGRYCAPRRCYCGDPSCPAYGTYGRALEPIGWTVNDERAVSSGRRASGTQRRRAHAADAYESGGR